MKKLLSVIILSMSIFLTGAAQNQKREKNVRMFMEGFTLSHSYDIQKLEKRISKKISKNEHLSNKNGLRFFHVWNLYPVFSFLWREDFNNGRFLLLRPDYYPVHRRGFLMKLFSRKKKYMYGETLVTDATGKLLAIFSQDVISGTYNGDDRQKLAKMFFDKELDFAFTDCFPSKYYCIKGDSLFALVIDENDLKHYTWDEFLDLKFGVIDKKE